MTEALYRMRWIAMIAVAFSVIGAALMFVVGGASVVRAIHKFFGGGEHDAFTEDAALRATVSLVSSLDEFFGASCVVSGTSPSSFWRCKRCSRHPVHPRWRYRWRCGAM